MTQAQDPSSNFIEDLLKEVRHFEPTAEFVKQANIHDPAVHDKAAADPNVYWAEWAKELQWDKPFKKNT
jgi:acetyl-CoA synthetase